MRSPKILMMMALAALPVASTLTLRADDFADKGREIFNKNQHAVVTVQVVIKSSAPSGRSSESKQDLTGTVVDPSGLTVLALSSCDPSEMYRRLSPDSKVEIEVTDIKMVLEDGTELPAEIVLRDRDLDMAFIRPKTKPPGPMTSVDLSKSGPAQVLDGIIVLDRLNKAASRAYAASMDRVTAVVQKPRTFYVPGSSTGSTTLGSPAFLPDGKLLGVFVMRATSGASGSYRDNLTAIILPAEDVLKASKQAPELKPDGDKKDDAKEPSASKSAPEQK
jgi:hypothetical protein